MSEQVGGRMILEAGDAVDIYERNAEDDVVLVRRARVKHTGSVDGQSMWQTPLGIFPEAEQ
jgi:plasmid stabilization system protein ParE